MAKKLVKKSEKTVKVLKKKSDKPVVKKVIPAEKSIEKPVVIDMKQQTIPTIETLTPIDFDRLTGLNVNVILQGKTKGVKSHRTEETTRVFVQWGKCNRFEGDVFGGIFNAAEPFQGWVTIKHDCQDMYPCYRKMTFDISTIEYIIDFVPRGFKASEWYALSKVQRLYIGISKGYDEGFGVSLDPIYS